MPPALDEALLPVMVQPVTVIWPELAMAAPEAPPMAVLLTKVQLVTIIVAELVFWMPPPGPPLMTELAVKVEFLRVIVADDKDAVDVVAVDRQVRGARPIDGDRLRDAEGASGQRDRLRAGRQVELDGVVGPQRAGDLGLLTGGQRATQGAVHHRN